MLSGGTPQRDWLAIRRAAADLADEIAQARDEAERIPDVSFEIFIAALEERLKRGETGAGRPGNTVVFSGMRQLRGLPYKVIVLWGSMKTQASRGPLTPRSLI